jgi:hypothetical protein
MGCLLVNYGCPIVIHILNSVHNVEDTVGHLLKQMEKAIGNITQV